MFFDKARNFKKSVKRSLACSWRFSSTSGGLYLTEAEMKRRVFDRLSSIFKVVEVAIAAQSSDEPVLKGGNESQNLEEHDQKHDEVRGSEGGRLAVGG